MTTSRLPEITVTCRQAGHSFPTRAHGAQAVDCPQCRAGGERVKVWVPKDRPRTARELAERGAIDGPATAGPAALASAELAARWGSEQPWDGKIHPAAGRPGDVCPECEGPVSWEPGRTLIYCPACPRAGLPAAVTDHYARQAQRSAEVATRPDSADSAALRAARVRIRAIAQRMTDTVGGWIETFDPDGLGGNAERLALDYQAELTAYLPEIRQAASEAELTDIAAEITVITSRASSSGAIDTIEQQREALQRQHERAEQEERWAEASRQRDQEQLAAQRRAEVERQRQAAIAARPERKAIQGTTQRRPALPEPTLANSMAPLIVMMEHSREAKAKRVAEFGTCDFRHRKHPVAERIYGIQTTDWNGQGTGWAAPGAKQARACSKHFAEALTWVEQIERPAQTMPCYWELGS